MRQALADIAHPGRDDFFDAACSDQLVKEDVRDRTDQGEVLPPLPDDLMASREGDEGFQG